MIDPTRLNATERQTLDLLARGHTAKSIAAITGRSVAAVNERLREARRKTGVGSSRELARLLQAQKDRDENIDLAAEESGATESEPEAAATIRGGPSRQGVLVMAILLIGGLALAAAAIEVVPDHSSGPQTAQHHASPPDPLLDGFFRQSENGYVGPDGRIEKNASTMGGIPVVDQQLHDHAHDDPRDPDWSVRAETALRDSYARIVRNGRADAPVRVICSARLCEAVVTTRSDLDSKQLNIFMAETRSRPLTDAAGKLGLTLRSIAIGPLPQNPAQEVSVSYWSRASG